MDLDEARDMLRASRFGVLALSQGGRSYALPLFFGYDGDHVYFHCHPGKKDAFIQSTREACLSVVHVESPNVWESVIVFGSIEKVTLNNELHAAKSALLRVPFPPLLGTFPGGTPIRSDQEVYHLKLTPRLIVGKKSTIREPAAATPR